MVEIISLRYGVIVFYSSFLMAKIPKLRKNWKSLQMWGGRTAMITPPPREKDFFKKKLTRAPLENASAQILWHSWWASWHLLTASMTHFWFSDKICSTSELQEGLKMGCRHPPERQNGPEFLKDLFHVVA